MILSIEKVASDYAERVCNGTFPIEYSRDQVVNHTKGDFIAGCIYLKSLVLDILKENAEAGKDLVPEDKARPSQEMVNEIDEDLIAIIESIK